MSVGEAPRGLAPTRPHNDTEAQAEFQMPPVLLGQQVALHNSNRRTSRPSLCVVLAVESKSLRLAACNPQEHVDGGPILHADDPRLMSHDHFRKGPCWTATEADIEAAAWRASVERRLEELETKPAKK